jgi:hypothetical protein
MVEHGSSKQSGSASPFRAFSGHGVASKHAPLTRLAASVQRKTTAGATSSGCIHGMPMTELGPLAATASCSVGGAEGSNLNI